MPPRTRAKQVAEQLTERINAGELVEGDRLPSVSQLAAEHGIATGTAARALDQLVADGLAHQLQGSGTFVGPADDVVTVVMEFTRADWKAVTEGATARGRRPEQHLADRLQGALSVHGQPGIEPRVTVR